MTWREFERAEDTPRSWWPSPEFTDPRLTRGWADATRWTGDGVSYLGRLPGGPYAIVRRRPEWSRMNAVDVCAGTYRDVPQSEDAVRNARDEAARQVVLAANGYCAPVRAVAAAGVDELLQAAWQLADRENAVLSILHIDDPRLLPAVRECGFETGITDLYPAISGLHGGMAGYVAGLPSRRRTMVRKDLRRFTDAGGQLRVLRGKQIADVVGDVARLEAETERQHGGTLGSDAFAETHERIVAAFGSRAVVLLAEAADGVPVASCSLVTGGDSMLVRTVGVAEDRARPVAGYFHAVYYGPIALAPEAGASRLLLGPGSLTPKIRRGARLTPLWSAVPRDRPCLIKVLRRTDMTMRDRLATNGGST